MVLDIVSFYKYHFYSGNSPVQCGHLVSHYFAGLLGVGISFQQIQKYEKGTIKIPVYRLEQMAEALGVGIASFFEKKQPPPLVSGPARDYGSESVPREFVQLLSEDERIFLKRFRKIRNRKLREALLKHMKGIIELEKKE